MIDTKLIGTTEAEFVPHFYGGTGKMEMSYGFSTRQQFVNQFNKPLANQTITVQIANNDSQEITTDANGYASFEVLTVKHYKTGNSQEHGGIVGTPERIDYETYTFNLVGHQSTTLETDEITTNGIIVLNADKQEGDNGEDEGENNDGNEQPNNSEERSGQEQTLPSELPATGTSTSEAALVAGTLGVTTYLATIEIRKRNRDL
jgi:hypothetical protein